MGVVFVERRAHRVGDADLDLAGMALQPHRRAGQRAAGADGADEAVDRPAGLVPDLLGGRHHMAVAVGDVVELVGPDRAVRMGLRQLLGEPAGQLHVIVGVLVRDGRHLDQLRAHQPQRVLLLLALRLRNDDHRAVAERVGDQRQADAGIAGGALDDHAAGLDQALLLGIADDEQPGAVLHRLARIEEFRLAVDLAAGLLGRPVEANERRVADGIDDGIVSGHVGLGDGALRNGSQRTYDRAAPKARRGCVDAARRLPHPRPTEAAAAAPLVRRRRSECRPPAPGRRRERPGTPPARTASP